METGPQGFCSDIHSEAYESQSLGPGRRVKKEMSNGGTSDFAKDCLFTGQE